MRRSEALATFSAAPFIALAGCSNVIPAVAPTRGSPLTPTTFGSQIYRSDDIEKALSLVAGGGGKLVRIDAGGDFTYFDALFAAASRYGLRVVLISRYSPQPVNAAGYARECALLHARYASFDPIWEIWNEPNLAAYWGAPPDVGAYVRLAVATATALRSAGAHDIWSGGTSGIDRAWIQGLVERGLFDSANGCAVHSYKPPGYARTEYIQAQGIIPRGVTLHTTETTTLDIDQSVFFDQMWWLHRELGLPTMIWAEFRDGTAGKIAPYTFRYGLVQQNYGPKPVYYAARSVVANF